MAPHAADQMMATEEAAQYLQSLTAEGGQWDFPQDPAALPEEPRIRLTMGRHSSGGGTAALSNRIVRNDIDGAIAKFGRALDEHGAFIHYEATAGENGALFMRTSGYPLQMMFDFFRQGFEDEHIAEMLDMHVEEVKHAAAFFESLT